MQTDEFERYLRLGLGRVILHLQTHDATPYQDLILHACLHNTTYDTQIEGFKNFYLMDILNLMPDKTFYRDKILDAAASTTDETDERDAGHLVELARLFAWEGDQRAREIVYDVFAANAEDEHSLGAWEIVRIDGVEGFLYVIDTLGEKVFNNPDHFESDYLLCELEEVVGENIARESLSEIRKTNRAVDAYLTMAERCRSRRSQPPQPPSEKAKANKANRERFLAQSYVEIKRRILEDKYPPRHWLILWGKNTDEENLRQAARDFLNEQDPKRLIQYLNIFFHAVYPLDPEPLFPLVDFKSDYFFIPARVFNVLKNITHPAVRDFALKLIADNRHVGQAVGLLNRNFQDGDWALIEPLSQVAYDDDFIAHNLQISVRAIVSDHPSKQAGQTLRNLYEYGPCSFCREHIVEELHALGELTDSIRAECHYDSNLDIRKLARNGFVRDEN